MVEKQSWLLLCLSMATLIGTARQRHCSLLVCRVSTPATGESRSAVHYFSSRCDKAKSTTSDLQSLCLKPSSSSPPSPTPHQQISKQNSPTSSQSYIQAHHQSPHPTPPLASPPSPITSAPSINLAPHFPCRPPDSTIVPDTNTGTHLPPHHHSLRLRQPVAAPRHTLPITP